MYNPRSSLDIFAMCRGIIGGCVIVSATAIYYKLWISILVGFVGGIIVVGSS